MCWVCNRKCPLCSQEAGWLVWSVKREGLKCVSDRQRVRYQVKTSKQASKQASEVHAANFRRRKGEEAKCSLAWC